MEGSVFDDGPAKVGGVRIEVKRECVGIPGEFECEFEFELEVEVEIEPPSIATDASGDYAIPVFPGNYEIIKLPDPDSLLLPETSRITLPEGSPPTIVNVNLGSGAIVTGEVSGGIVTNTNPGGLVTLLPDIEVIVFGEPGDLGAFDDTDNDGIYSLLGPIGTYTLLLKAKAGSLLDVALKPVPDVNNALLGPNTVNIVAEAETEGPIRIEGKVFEPDGVTPAAGVDIFARYKDTNLIGRAYSDRDGNYVLVIK